MLGRLGHDALVGGDNPEDEVDAPYAGQHVLNKFLMPGDIDYAGAPPARQVKKGETEVDGDAPFFFFF